MKTNPIKSDKIIPVYKNGVGIYEVIKELQRQANEMRSGEIGKRNLLLAE